MAQSMTPTEVRFYQLLSDGHGHTPEELHALLWDEQTERNGAAVRIHISNLRPKLPGGVDIMLRKIAGVSYYQLVRLLADDE